MRKLTALFWLGAVALPVPVALWTNALLTPQVPNGASCIGDGCSLPTTGGSAHHVQWAVTAGAAVLLVFGALAILNR